MKVQYLLTPEQVRAISLLVHIDGTTICENIKDRQLVEYTVPDDLKDMLDTLLNQNGLAFKEKPQWPSQGDPYYYIDNDGEILRGRWEAADNVNSRVDRRRCDIGNIFKTEEEAQFESERLKVLSQLKSLSDDDQKWNQKNLHYHIAYELPFGKLEVWDSSCVKLPNEYYFKSTASAKAAIKTIGEDRLKKYVFGIKEKEN